MRDHFRIEPSPPGGWRCLEKGDTNHTCCECVEVVLYASQTTKQNRKHFWCRERLTSMKTQSWINQGEAVKNRKCFCSMICRRLFLWFVIHWIEFHMWTWYLFDTRTLLRISLTGFLPPQKVIFSDLTVSHMLSFFKFRHSYVWFRLFHFPENSNYKCDHRNKTKNLNLTHKIPKLKTETRELEFS